MPGSINSLGSLSSPSPSPSPPPESNKPPETTGAGLDSDSELSELTEEEQEAVKQNENQARNQNGSNGNHNRRQLRPSRRGGRRKRSSIVPAPMWGWAETKTTNVVEEEEEEEMAGPPRAMEEEEEEEEEDEGDESVGPPFSRPGPSKNLLDDEGEDDRPEDEEADQTLVIDAADEEESVSGDDGPPARGRRVRRSARVSRTQDDIESSGTEDEADLPQKNREDQDEDEDEDDDLSDAPPGPADGIESENETESEDEGSKEQDDVDAVTPALSTSAISKPSTKPASNNVDVTAPSPQAVAPLAAAAAASSIMAGSAVLNAPSPSPSSSSAGSPASSRSPSPAPPRAKSSEVTEVDGISRPKRESKQKKISATEKDADGSVVKAVPAALDLPDIDMDNEIPDHEQDPDRSAEDVEVDDISPEQDLEMELESDLQPAHRAEALDVLATIELKFALLRERVYVEKMEGLAWEEALVSEGTHPELIHLHAELLKRRDKRIELATRKRGYEMANVIKRRRVDEDATWSWWKLARDDLQTDMISETNRKRRRLERERRAVERPQPVRRLPSIPHDTPIPPTLRKIVKSFPFGNRRQNKRDLHPTSLMYPELATLSSADINLDLDILYHYRRPAYDPHRMGGMNMNGQMGSQVLPPHGYDSYNDAMSIPPPFGSTNRMQPPPPPPFQQHHPPTAMQQQVGAQSMPVYPGFGGPGPGSGRVHHQQPPHAPTPLHNHPMNHGQSQFAVDQEMGGPSQHVQQQHAYFGSAQGGGYPGHGGGRRSISPVPVMTNGSGPKQNGGWAGMGMGMGMGFHGGPKASEWMGEGRRGDIGMGDEEERERERAARRDREKRERDQELERRDSNYQMQQFMQQQHHHQQQQQQHRHPPPPQHQHTHTSTGQAPHHHAPPHHHHHHHHHVLHHHHGQGNSSGHASSSLPPGGSSLSPRAPPSREFDNGRPHSGPVHQTEIINLSSSKPMSSHWKGDDPHAASSDYREIRKHGGRPASGPPMQDDRERPLAMPFVMTSTHTMQSGVIPSSNSAPNGTSSPRGAWNTAEDNAYRIPPSSSAPAYLGSHESHTQSPGPHRYPSSSSGLLGRGPPPPPQLPLSRQSSMGHSPPRTRPIRPPSPSSSSTYPNNPIHSPKRFVPPPPAAHSPNLKIHRPGSPALATKMLSASGGGGPPGGSVYSPRLAGPGRTSTPTGLTPSADIKSAGGGGASGTTATVYTVGSRTASPLGALGGAGGGSGLPFPSPSSHPSLPPPLTSRPLGSANGAGPDRDRDRHASPRLPVLAQPKMNVAQMVDGH